MLTLLAAEAGAAIGTAMGAAVESGGVIPLAATDGPVLVGTGEACEPRNKDVASMGAI